MTVTHEQAERINLKDELAPLRRLKEAKQSGQNLSVERERLFNEELTDIAEAIDHMYLESRFEYGFDGKQTVLPDGTALAGMYQRGVEVAERLSKIRPVYSFELERRRAEAANQDLVDAMMRGEVEANTIIELSPYPEEAARFCEPKQLEDMGYKPNLKRSMVRIIRREDNHGLSLTTFTLDNSNLESFQALQTALGQTPDTSTNHILANPAMIDTEESVNGITDRLTRIYDRQLETQTGSPRYRGRENTTGNSMVYVQAAQPAIQAYLSQLEILGQDWANETIGPDLAEVIKIMLNWRNQAEHRSQLPAEIKHRLASALSNQRLDESSVGVIKRALEIGTWASIVKKLDNPGIVVSGDIQDIISNAYEAEASDQRMVGCGGSTSLFSAGRTVALEQVFGAGLRLETRYSFNRLMHCVVCQKPPRQNPNAKKAEGRKWCGPCGICRGCDSKLKRKK